MIPPRIVVFTLALELLPVAAWPRLAAFSRLTGSELFAQAQTLVRLSAEQPKPNEERLPEFTFYLSRDRRRVSNDDLVFLNARIAATIRP